MLIFWGSQSDLDRVKSARAALLTQVVRVVPTDAVYSFLGAHHQDGNRLAQAAAYQHLALREPNSIEAHIGLSNCYRAMGKHEAAVEVLRRLTEACPDYTFGYVCLAQNYSDLKHYAAAIWALKKAITLEPNMATLHLNLGKTYLSIGDYDTAMPCFLKAIDADKRNAHAHFELAKTYVLADRMDLARKHYRILRVLNDGLAEDIQAFGNL
jgi:tetratricopeptide (TPR) repeat protein